MAVSYPILLLIFRKAKGERLVVCTFYAFNTYRSYRYMDYAFLNALNYISLLLLFMLMYDIMCQWFPNFFSRIHVKAVSDIIKIRDDVVLKRAIGLFHVHGHIKECYPRYASTFIRGAGIVDGEIIETLWHILNHTASSARSMSWYHRQEYLDCHMGDSNWKKLTRMGNSASALWLFMQYLLKYLSTNTLSQVGSLY